MVITSFESAWSTGSNGNTVSTLISTNISGYTSFLLGQYAPLFRLLVSTTKRHHRLDKKYSVHTSTDHRSFTVAIKSTPYIRPRACRPKQAALNSSLTAFDFRLLSQLARLSWWETSSWTTVRMMACRLYSGR